MKPTDFVSAVSSVVGTLRRVMLVVVSSLIWSGCAPAGCDDEPFEEPMVLGGREVSADTLNRGYRVYRYNCIACHGEAGDGKGPSAGASTPRPRDFTTGIVKFKSTPGDALPLDADLRRTVERGLDGTNMNAFDLGEEDTQAVIDYIKTFSPRWVEETPPAPVAMPRDPWSGRRMAAIERGKWLYHGVAVCWQCHPAYLERARLEAVVGEAASERDAVVSEDVVASAWRARLGAAVEVSTTFGKLLPPDFHGGTLRAARTEADFFRTVAAGVGGTEMPVWSEKLPSEDVWALAYYVRELQRLGNLR